MIPLDSLPTANSSPSIIASGFVTALPFRRVSFWAFESCVILQFPADGRSRANCGSDQNWASSPKSTTALLPTCVGIFRVMHLPGPPSNVRIDARYSRNISFLSGLLLFIGIIGASCKGLDSTLGALRSREDIYA